MEVRCGETLIIFDAGSGMRELGNELVVAGRPIEAHILISHTHWDHLQGFPFFAPFYTKGNVLHLYGPQGADETLEAILKGQMALPYFPVLLSDAAAKIEFHELDVGQCQIGEAWVTTMFANHPGICLVYRLEWHSRAVVYLCDCEPYRQLAMPQEVEPDSGLVGILGEGIDSRLAEFSREADLLIADTAYDCAEYKQRRGWGHGCVDDVVQIALDARIKRLAFFHHDPSHADEKIDEMVERGRRLLGRQDRMIECFGAREGMQVEL